MSAWWNDPDRSGPRGRHAQRLPVVRARASWEPAVAAVARLFLAGLAALGVCLLVAVASLISKPVHAQTIPLQAERYQLTLKREAQRVWGLDAPVATFAAQIHQESRWRADARSPVGALGLAQFMPGTANWIGSMDVELRDRAPMNPTWALRGLVVYDRWLWDRIKADTPCERMAFTLSAYNGGLGWVYKRQRLSDAPGVCLGGTCSINPGIAPANQRENEHYPRVILGKHEALYRLWGAGSCE